MRCAAIATGIVAGLGLSATLGYLWMIFGADPNKDPLLSF